MRFVFWCAAIALVPILVSGAAQAAEPSRKPPGKRLALVVGVKEYKHAALDSLKYTENDAAELAAVLRAAGYRVTLMSDSEGEKNDARHPTRVNIDRELKAMLKGIGRDDVVLVGLAGHGLQPDGTAESYFCPADANPSIDRGDGNGPATARFPETLISVRGLLKDLDDSGAGRRFLLVDACRNDPGARGRGVADLLGYTGETGVLLSCSKGQRSFEPDALKHGLFFYYVIQGFKGGAKDPETNEVTWDDLRKYVKRQVSRNVPKAIKEAGGVQTPQEFGTQTGEPFVLVTPIRTAPEADARTEPRPPVTVEKKATVERKRPEHLKSPDGDFEVTVAQDGAITGRNTSGEAWAFKDELDPPPDAADTQFYGAAFAPKGSEAYRVGLRLYIARGPYMYCIDSKGRMFWRSKTGLSLKGTEEVHLSCDAKDVILEVNNRDKVRWDAATGFGPTK